MARPPKSSTRKPVSHTPAPLAVKAKPVESTKPEAKPETAAPAKPMPFEVKPEPVAPKAPEPVAANPEPVIAEPAPVAEPVAEATPVEVAAPKAAPAETVSIEAPSVAPAPVRIPVQSTVFTPSTPSQPVMAEPFAAAMESVGLWQTPQILEGNQIMNEAIETTKKFAEDAKTRVQSLLADMNDKAKAAMEKSSRAMEEMGDLTKGNLEAVVESSRIAAKGFESIGQNAAEYGRLSFEKTSATLKSFASVKSPAEFIQLQSELVTSTFDAIASESAKTSEAVLKLAGEIAQPISSRVAVVSDKFKALAA